METKYCPKCNETKPMIQFHKNKSKYDGYGSYCKPCANEYSKVSIKKSQQRNFIRNKENPPVRSDDTFKKCTTCKETFPTTMFNLALDKIDGLSSSCKNCISIRNKVRTLRKNNDEPNTKSIVSIIDEFKRAKILRHELYDDSGSIVSIANRHRMVLIGRIVNNNPKFKIVKADEMIAN